jgi:hypothetical protein
MLVAARHTAAAGSSRTRRKKGRHIPTRWSVTTTLLPVVTKRRSVRAALGRAGALLQKKKKGGGAVARYRSGGMGETSRSLLGAQPRTNPAAICIPAWPWASFCGAFLEASRTCEGDDKDSQKDLNQ